MKQPDLGFGLGLRPAHFENVLNGQSRVDWFEVISENFFVEGGKPLYYLNKIRADYPIALHGVSLSIGSTDTLDLDYLSSLKTLSRLIEPSWLSDHLCWTRDQGINSHDLLPLPYSEEALTHVVERVGRVQEYLGRPIALENVSSYVTFSSSQMSEWTFLNEVARQSGCGILLDINNIYVSSRNHDFDPRDYLNAIDPDHVWQYHLAGHSDMGEYVIDTHDAPVCDAVFELYREALAVIGHRSAMIERDDHIPEFVELESELEIVRTIAAGEFHPREQSA